MADDKDTVTADFGLTPSKSDIVILIEGARPSSSKPVFAQDGKVPFAPPPASTPTVFAKKPSND